MDLLATVASNSPTILDAVAAVVNPRSVISHRCARVGAWAPE